MFNQSEMPSHSIPRHSRQDWLAKLRTWLKATVLVCATLIAASGSSFAAGSNSDAKDNDNDNATGLHYGYIDKTGQFVIKPIYLFVSPFSEDCAVVTSATELQVIDKTGKVLFKRATNGALASIPRPYKEGLSVANDGLATGFADKTGKFVIEPKYQMARDFSEGLAAVASADFKNWAPMTWSFIDKSGKTVIAGPFQLAFSFSQGLAAVEIGDKWGFIDQTGKFVIPAKYSWASSFSEDRAIVSDKDSSLFHYIDNKGADAFDGAFGVAARFSEGVACFGYKANKLDGLIDKHGKKVQLPEGLEFAGDCSNGLITVRNSDDDCGFANQQGELVIKPTFDGARSFSEGLAPVAKNEQWGFIDPSGKMVIPPAFSEAQVFSEGLAGVCEGTPASK